MEVKVDNEKKGLPTLYLFTLNENVNHLIAANL